MSLFDERVLAALKDGNLKFSLSFSHNTAIAFRALNS
jgi:hypothetical protein